MNDSYKGHKVIVFALEHYNPLGQIRSLGENGIFPIFFSIKRYCYIASKSKYCSKVYYADTVEDGYRLLLNTYGNYDYEHRPLLLFSDDKSIGFFDFHYDELKDRFIMFNAGKSGRINEFMNKKRILEIAQKYGFNVLDSVVADRGMVPENLIYPIITKDISPNSGSWKSDVFICENESELKNAFTKITSPKILIQHFIDKKNELALQGFSVARGTQMVIGTQHTWKYLIRGYYSPYHNVTMFTNSEMQRKLQAMFSEIGYEGVFEVEFLIDQDGTYYFLEVNLRASCFSYASTIAGIPLSFLWVKSMVDGFMPNDIYKSFDDFSAMAEPIDFGKRVDTGKIPIAEWVRDFRQAKCTYYYNENDMAPFEVLFKHWGELK